MTRSLPPKPSLRFLQEEAKDLLKAQRHKDPEACAVLRNLRGLADKPDPEILAGKVSLQQVQFALAMDYGFKTWDELKAHVAIFDATNSDAHVLREGEKVFVANVPPKTGTNSVLASLTSCLKSLGEAVSYEFLMGVGSHAFRMQFNWCPSAPHAFCGFNTSHPALNAVGYSLVQLPTNRPSHRDDLDGPSDMAFAKSIDAVRATIDRGVPGIMDWEETDVLVGYEQKSDGSMGLIKGNGDSVEEMPWSVGILSREPSKPAKVESVLWSLRTAVSHAHSATSSGPSADERMVMTYTGGFAAWERWIRELQPGFVFPKGGTGDGEPSTLEDMADNAWSGVCLGNAWTLESLIDARFSAAKYLRTVPGDAPAEAAPHLRLAADEYDETARDLEQAYTNVRYPWKPNARQEWTPEARCKQAEAMAVAFEHEKQAVRHIERALTAME